MRLINNDPIIQLRKKKFWKPLFSTFHDTLFVIDQKHFFGFSKSAATLRYTILDSRITLCNTSSEAGALQSEVHIEIYDSKYMTQKKISKSKIFQIFFWKPLFSTFHDTLFVIKRKYFFGFPKSAPTPRYTILDSRLPLCNTSSEAGALLPAIRGTYYVSKYDSNQKKF